MQDDSFNYFVRMPGLKLLTLDQASYTPPQRRPDRTGHRTLSPRSSCGRSPLFLEWRWHHYRLAAPDELEIDTKH